MTMSESGRGYKLSMDSVAIEYRPDDYISKKFGPILMAFPGHITYMSIEEAEELISKLQDAVSTAKEDIKEKELIEIDFDELSDAEIKVLLMMNEDGTPISPSRLQRINQLYEELYESRRENDE